MRALVLLATLALATPSVAASPRDELLAPTSWLAERLGDPNLVILHVGDRAGYEAGHIPGARLLTLADIAAPMGGEALTLELPDPETLRAKLAAVGVSDRSRIVVVPTREGLQSATRVVFTLEAAGLGARTVLLDGGAAAWAAEGRPLTKDVPVVATGRLAPLRYRTLVVDASYVRDHANAPGYKIVDSRARDFFTGARAGGSPARPHKAGRVKGAVSVPFTSVATPDLKLASPEDIAAHFKAAGVKKGDTVITYCHVGQQATATWFAARTLGLDVKLYDGSFEEWSRIGGAVDTGE